MPGGSGDYKDEGYKSDEHNVIPTTSWERRAPTELKLFDLEPSDVDGYEDLDGNDAEDREKEHAVQADNGSKQNVEVSGHSRFDMETSSVNTYEGKDGDDVDPDQ